MLFDNCHMKYILYPSVWLMLTCFSNNCSLVKNKPHRAHEKSRRWTSLWMLSLFCSEKLFWQISQKNCLSCICEALLCLSNIRLLDKYFLHGAHENSLRWAACLWRLRWNFLENVIWQTSQVRPWSVDSLDGGSTDAMKIPPIEK